MFGFFSKLLYTIMYNVAIRWSREVLRAVEEVILKLSHKEVLEMIFFHGKKDKSLAIPPLLYYFIIIGSIIILFLLISNLIIAYLNSEATTKKQKIVESFKNSIRAALVLVAMPILFLIILLIFGIFQEVLSYGTTKFSDNKYSSFTDMVHQLGWVNGKSGEPSWSDLGDGYNPLIALVGFIFLALNLFNIGKQLITKSLELFLYYFIGPFVAAKMSYDYGKSFNKWRDEVINKFLLILAIILPIAITMSSINYLIKVIDNASGQLPIVGNLQKSIIKLLIIIISLGFMTTASELIINVLGENDDGSRKSILKEKIQNAFNRIKKSRKSDSQPQSMVPNRGPATILSPTANNRPVNKLAATSINASPVKRYAINTAINTLSQSNNNSNAKFQKNLIDDK